MIISFSEKLYNKDALVKAAYHFTDVAYLVLIYGNAHGIDIPKLT